MKDMEKQIEFIDKKLLKLFEIKSIKDYDKIIYLDDLEKTFDISKINNLMDDIKDIFPVKDFNFHKTENKIISPKHAFNVLKKCLEIALIPHDVDFNKKRKYLRLISFNNVLYRYIEKNQMETSEKRTLKQITSEYGLCKSVDIIDQKVINYKDISEKIKKEHMLEIFFCPERNYDDQYNEITISLLNYGLNNKCIKNIKLDIFSDKSGKYEIISQSFINEILKDAKCFLTESKHQEYKINTNFKLNENIFPDNFLLPIQCMKYHNVNVVLKNVKEFKKILNLLTVKLTVTYVELYSDFEKLLHSCPIEIDIKIDNIDANKLRIMNGMWGIAYTKNSKEDKQIKDIKGNYVELGKFKGFKVSDKEYDTKFNNNPALLALGSINNIDFSCYNLQLLKHDYYCCKIGDQIRHIYNFEENIKFAADTVSDIEIIAIKEDKELDDGNFSIKCSSKNNFKFKNILECVMEKIKKTNTVSISSVEKLHINRHLTSDIILEIESCSLEKPLTILNANCLAYHWQSDHRRKFSQENNHVINF